MTADLEAPVRALYAELIESRRFNVMIARNIPVTFMPPPEPEPDVDELLREPGSKAPAPKPKIIGTDPDSKLNKLPPKKNDPAKPKEPARRDGEPLLRPFRRV